MINRIRDIRSQKGLTLAQVAEACSPPTTAQTIGRLETGMRNLSLTWMNRIAAALGVEPETLLRSDNAETPKMVASLTESGAEALASPMDAVLPTDLAAAAPLMAVSVNASCGEYRSGDQIWLRQIDLKDHGQAINRDVLVPRPGGRFAFGRLIDRQGTMIGILPPGMGQRQIVVDNPPWIAVAQMLVRPL